MTMAAQLRAAHRALAWNMLDRRQAQRLTIEAAAWKAQVAPRHWQKMEGGEANPTLITLVKVAYALGINIVDLFAPAPSSINQG